MALGWVYRQMIWLPQGKQWIWSRHIALERDTNDYLKTLLWRADENCLSMGAHKFRWSSNYIDIWAVAQMCPVFTCIIFCPINNGQWNTMSQSWRIALVTYATQYIIVIIWTKYTILKLQKQFLVGRVSESQ